MTKPWWRGAPLLELKITSFPELVNSSHRVRIAINLNPNLTLQGYFDACCKFWVGLLLLTRQSYRGGMFRYAQSK